MGVGMSEGELVAEKLLHTIDLLRAEMRELHQASDRKIGELEAQILRLREGNTYQKELHDHRLAQLEGAVRDHEERLREATDGVTQFKVWSGLAAGGSGLVSLAALIRAWFGG
jgi:hypothetical protein